MSTRDRLLAVLVAVIWGVNFLAIDLGLHQFPPLFFAGLRFLVLAVPALLFIRRPDVPIGWLIGYGIGFGVLEFGFLFVAMHVGMPTGLASLVLQASAPFTVVLGAVFLRERLRLRQVVGIVAAVTGMAVIVWHRAQVAAVVPVLLTLAGALGWAIGNLCSRKAMSGAAPSVNAVHVTMWMSVVPVLPLFALSAAVEGPAAGWRSVLTATDSPTGWWGLAGLVYIALVSTVVATGAWTGLMRRNPAGVVAPFSMLVPVVGMALAAAVLGERPDAIEVLAGIAVIAGVLIGARPARPTRPGCPTEPADRVTDRVTVTR